VAVDHQSEISLSRHQGTLPWQPILVGFYLQKYTEYAVLRWTNAAIVGLGLVFKSYCLNVKLTRAPSRLLYTQSNK